MRIPINLKKWISDNRDLLKPPVCNKVVWEDSDFISSERLYEHYGAFQKGSRHQYEPVQLSDIKKGLEKWCPQARHIRKMNNNLQSRGYQLPSLKEGREVFGQILKHDINWE